MKSIIYIIILLLLTGCAGVSKSELKKQWAYTALVVADWSQTKKIDSTPGIAEVNPFFGSPHPSQSKINTLIPLGLLAGWVGLYVLPKEWRVSYQASLITAESYAILNNYQHGLQVGF